MTEGLLALEGDPGSATRLAEVFREAHTLKGAAGLVGLQEVSAAAHEMEDVLDELRSGRRRATPEITDGLLADVDRLRRLIEGPAAAPAVQPASAGEPEDEPETPPPPPAASSGAAPAMLQVPVERMDELARLVGEAAAAQLRIGHVLASRLGTDPDALNEYRDLARMLNRLQAVAMRARMVPLATVGAALHRAVRDVARAEGKAVRWELRGEDTEIDRGVLERLADPLLHLVRNAVGHGIELPQERVAAGKAPEGFVRLHAMQLGSEVVIAVSDDGRGIDVARVRQAAEQRGIQTSGLSDETALQLVFRTGLSTAREVSELSGRGVGLDVLSAALQKVRGRVEVRTELGLGSEFRIVVPITLTIVPCLLVSSAGQAFAIPMHSVMGVLEPSLAGLPAGGRRLVVVKGQAMPLAGLAPLLGLGQEERGPCVVVGDLARAAVLRVESLLGQRDVVVRGLGGLVPRLEVVSGASVEPDGSVLLVLDVGSLLQRAAATVEQPAAGRPAVVEPAVDSRRSLLVVDDALTVRELQRSILERAGYRVLTAADGKEALAVLAEHPADLVLSDVEMPHMDGYALTASIRRHPRLGNVPVLLLTSRDSDEDRRRGLEAGADRYLVKSAFDQAGLLSAVASLLGSEP
jgi:two-component system, chemotaxis family, sensor kinase CheA